MIFIKKGRNKYPIINSPISKLYLIDLINTYPKGFYIRTGKKLKFFKNQLDYKKYDIKIDFLNSMKVFGIILSAYYFFTVKRKVKKKLSRNSDYVNKRMNEIRNKVKKKAQQRYEEPLKREEEE